MNLPEKIFAFDQKVFRFGSPDDFVMCTKEDFDSAQVGFRINDDGETIKDWVGDNFFVIGTNECCGDPILVDVSKEDLPIYFLVHDDWNLQFKIAESIDIFYEILELMDGRDFADRETADKVIKTIYDITPDCGDYWEDLINGIYEFLN